MPQTCYVLAANPLVPPPPRVPLQDLRVPLYMQPKDAIAYAIADGIIPSRGKEARARRAAQRGDRRRKREGLGPPPEAL